MESLLPGTEVIARGLRWEVVFVQPAGAQSILRLRCREGGPSLQGREIDLLSPLETVTPASTPLDPAHAGRLQDWRVYHDAFLLEQRLGPDALLAAQPGRLRPAAYQLVPVLRALALPRPRLLLADDVGLGKTVEAGMILAELIARRLAHRVLVVSPAGPLMRQWREEMRERFGLRFRVLDADALKEIRYAQELGANPFDHEALSLISIDFAKQERVLQDLERTHYDLVILDEAHHCVSLGEVGDREDSQRRRLAEVLARRTDGLLLLTATPHDGHDTHFASLLSLLDPSLVDGKGIPRERTWERHVVRRLKRHIRDERGEAMFRERKVIPVGVALDAAKGQGFARFQSALLALVAPLLKRARRKKEFAEVLAMVSLLKRSVSTAAACAFTLQAVAMRLDDLANGRDDHAEARRQRIKSLRDLSRRASRYDDLSAQEQQDLVQFESEELAVSLADLDPEELEGNLGSLFGAIAKSRKTEKRAERTRDALQAVAALAREARSEDPKLHALVSAVREIRATEPEANVLVYTEYADSMVAAHDALVAERSRGGLVGQVLMLSGDDAEAARALITARFTREDGLVLVSTDASAEGLNLHARCHHLIHLELPYNPNRLEQRNGRIDRFGQTLDPTVRYLFLEGTFEERLLWRLAERYEKQKSRLGFVPNTLGASFTGGEDGGLLAGIADDAGERAAKTLTLVGEDELLQGDAARPVYRDMLDEIDRVLAGSEKVARTHTWLGDTGMQAARANIEAAHRARAEGQRLGVVDLLHFVVSAVRADSSDANPAREVAPGQWELLLPVAWHGGMEEVPGWEPASGTLRLTTDVLATHDAERRPLGYLGRAHPIVRRALDRVRHIQHGAAGAWLDRRVAVARGDDGEPAVIYTALGRVQSRAGTAFERVLAVRLTKRGALEVLDDVSDWAHLTDPSRALPPKDVWKTHFAAWADTSPLPVLAQVRARFDALVAAWRPSLEGSLDEERRALESWLAQRSTERCGEPRSMGLFRDDTVPRWQLDLAPAERLAHYANDARQPPGAKAEARSLLEIHRKRREVLDRLGALEAPTVSLLGMLLLVPAEARRGA